MSNEPVLELEKRSRGVVIHNRDRVDVALKRVVIYYRYTVATKRGMGIIHSSTSYASKTGKEYYDINREVKPGESVFIDFTPTDSIVKVEIIGEVGGRRFAVNKTI